MAVVRSGDKKKEGKKTKARVVNGDSQDGGEIQEEQSLRPQTLGDIIGRTDESAALKVLIDAARKRSESVLGSPLVQSCEESKVRVVWETAALLLS